MENSNMERDTFFLFQPQLAFVVLIVLVSVYGLTFNFKCKYFYKNVYFHYKKKKNCYELYWTYL